MGSPVWLASTSVLLVLAGCASTTKDGGDGRGPVAADCTQVVRFDGREYRGVAYAAESRAGKRLGRADQAECDDLGPEARGAYFPDRPRREGVRALRGYDPREVIVAAGPEDLVAVFVVEDAPRRRVDEITDDVTP